MGEVKIEFQENMLKIGTLLIFSRLHRSEDENYSVWLNFGHIYNLGEFHLRFKKTCFVLLLTKTKRPQGWKSYFPSLRSGAQNVFNNQNKSGDQNFRGHFEMTVIDHIETIEVAVAHFEKRVIYHFEGTVCFRTFKGSFMLLYEKSIGLISKKKSSFIISKL